MDTTKAKLSQLSFSDLKSFKQLYVEDMDKIISSAHDAEQKDDLSKEKNQTLEVINQAISTKIFNFLNS